MTSSSKDIDQLEDIESVNGFQRASELDLDLIFEDTDYSWGKSKMILDLVHFSGYNRFSEILEIMPNSKATVSKYLNGLKDAGLLEKNVKNDRAVIWEMTEKGILVVLYHVYLYVPEDVEDPVKFLKNKSEEIRKYSLEREFDRQMTSNDLEDVEEKFDCFRNDYEDDPLKAFLKTFLRVDTDNYIYAVTRKET